MLNPSDNPQEEHKVCKSHRAQTIETRDGRTRQIKIRNILNIFTWSLMGSDIRMELLIQIQSQHLAQNPKPGTWLFSPQWSNKNLWFRHWIDWNQINLLTLQLKVPCNQLHTNYLTWKSYFSSIFLNFPAFYTSWFCPCQKHNCQNIIPDLESFPAKMHPQDDYAICWGSLNYPYFEMLKQPYSSL